MAESEPMKLTTHSLCSRRTLAVSAAALCYVLFLGWSVLHDDGMVGATTKNGFGCICHSATPSDSVTVWIEGPARMRKGTGASFLVLMTGGPAVKGGFNVAAGRGPLSPRDTTSQLLLSELTQILPKAFVSDTVRWEFFYQAPDDTTEDTLFSVGNSVNDNHNPTGDAYNFGADFIVDLYGDSATAAAREDLPPAFGLLQNYPNPFNPATAIRFELEREGHVQLELYDVGGRLVGTLVRERREAGVHEVSWDAAGMPGGIYFCRLSASGYSTTKKMILMK